MKMGTRHCISRLMLRMNTNITARKRDLVKINGPPKNARKSANTPKRSRSATKVVKRIARKHAKNVVIKDFFY